MQRREETLSHNPKQFLHMHHMKTGGTTIDRMLGCMRDRADKMAAEVAGNGAGRLKYFRVSECATGSIERCQKALDRGQDARYVRGVFAFSTPTCLAVLSKTQL
jgi:hypothetical protein